MVVVRWENPIRILGKFEGDGLEACVQDQVREYGRPGGRRKGFHDNFQGVVELQSEVGRW